ncbi:enoyl-CoA hydratase/carnithine racemase [Mumia flava]|uniref:Enoyl-CoA hydratase/carnithine racemase n=1 Tax=Mumia flava TaxID=1348852 RepID=A0A0B2B743_9ACTN|nr:enoyl-CoA hydratase/isomerase family protein [Mumia flava]PJJ57618.1 enoyl-CoA hydratase/carnithine racemase [Mumia flava]
MTVELSRDNGGVAILTIAAPPVNLYTTDLHDAFEAALDAIEAEPPRALLIRAEGRVVSGGVDVGLFDAQSSAAEGKVLFDRMLELPLRIAALDLPVVFAAHGLCLTWALEVALACDLIVASDRARFGLVEKVVGLTPTMGGTQRFASRAGIGRAKEFVMTGDLYDAATLERWGVVNRVHPADELDDAVGALVASLAAGPTRAHAATKEVLRRVEAGGVAAADEAITSIAAALYDTEDMRNAIRSFLTDGPGKATYTGR